MPGHGLRIEVADDVDLVLREEQTVPEMRTLISENLDRLRRWEPWAHGEQTEEAARGYARLRMQAFADGKALPLAIRADGALVGAVGAQLDAYTGTATLGFRVAARGVSCWCRVPRPRRLRSARR